MTEETYRGKHLEGAYSFRRSMTTVVWSRAAGRQVWSWGVVRTHILIHK